MLCLPSGECLCPDATVCTTLMSALYSSAGQEVVLSRQLMVNVSMSPKDNYCIEVVLRCLALAGDGLGPHELNDGGYSQRHYGCWFQRYMVDVWWNYSAEKSCSLLSVIVERNVKVMVNFDEMKW
ncbi:hypothetical protein QN277_024022 [Acacia crassicarpa]|uniref:Uncharacterized protein n=1 Tax=Acacia crassicarpa TaxID=499986 RepID=A0AAE1JBC0_9FABA|nr:hypothetical protein QN277_024022 [Acacia crassicarpa]